MKQSPKYIQDQELRNKKEAKLEQKVKEHEQMLERQKANQDETINCDAEGHELPSAHYANTNYLNQLDFIDEFNLPYGSNKDNEFDLNDEI